MAICSATSRKSARDEQAEARAMRGSPRQKQGQKGRKNRDSKAACFLAMRAVRRGASMNAHRVSVRNIAHDARESPLEYDRETNS
jgi:hypothetical protein